MKRICLKICDNGTSIIFDSKKKLDYFFLLFLAFKYRKYATKVIIGIPSIKPDIPLPLCDIGLTNRQLFKNVSISIDILFSN